MIIVGELEKDPAAGGVKRLIGKIGLVSKVTREREGVTKGSSLDF